MDETLSFLLGTSFFVFLHCILLLATLKIAKLRNLYIPLWFMVVFVSGMLGFMLLLFQPDKSPKLNSDDDIKYNWHEHSAPN